jgi:predicted helicase
MSVIGNPPYSGESANKGEWIMSLMEDYKKEPGGKEKLKERNPKWINADENKFIRYGQHYIEKNGSGILAFINPHSFLDNPTFRGMRWHLLKTFDKIYTIDLHGNSKKNETAADGSVDVNVFDIMQGVSINIFVKTGTKKANELGKVFHYDLFGKREFKYDFLLDNSIKSIPYKELPNIAPNYFFVNKDFDEQKIYENGFKVSEIFASNNVGIVTSKDAILINESKNELLKNVEDFYQIQADKNIIKPISYRPFDNKFIYYDVKIIERAREKSMQHFFNGKNIGLVIARQCVGDWKYIFISKLIGEFNLTGTAGRYGSGNYFPLYLYPETKGQQTIGQTTERTPNLNTGIVKQLAEKLDLTFTNEKTSPTPPKEGLSQPGYITANAKNYFLIKEMRDSLKDNPTEAEKVMWEYLRNKKTGYKIRRQHIIDDFITDFVCLIKNVVIEIDGKIHLQQKEYDELRTARLNELGYEVIRFTNEEVFANPELVTLKIKEKLDSKSDLQSDETPPNLPKVEEQNSPPLEGQGEVFAPIDILDYIYAVLHSPTYREKYKEFLKIDFPRVPYPKDKGTFWQLVKLGGQIREIHLLESPTVEKYITQYPIDGDNVVTKPRFVILNNSEESQNKEMLPVGQHDNKGKVFINDTQYFDNVPQIAWDFFIGGYQPAQKWLKDRKDRKLEFDDILHYQKIIVALSETHRLMQEINNIEIE